MQQFSALAIGKLSAPFTDKSPGNIYHRIEISDYKPLYAPI